MKKLEIMNTITRSVGKAKLTVKKYSPEILLVTGVAGVVVSAVMACKATTKLDAVLETAKHEVDAVHEAKERGHVIVSVDEETGEVVTEEYTEEDHKKDLAIVYIKNGVKFAKLYGPAVVMGISSVGCILASNNIIRKRNVALAAAFNVTDSAFKEYRGRVVERFGEELDRELRYNIKAQEVEEVVTHEDGTESTVKKTVYSAELNDYSKFAKIFDEYCKGWSKDPEANLFYLRQVQDFCNKKLKSQGYLFLNDVYKELGIRPTPAGQVVGWIYDEARPIGDNYVDFGLYDIHDEGKRLFVNGHERNVIIDFNVDGVIYDLI